MKDTPPRDGLIRARTGDNDALELREDEDSKMPTLRGHFATFNEWTEIDSIFEGRFMERIAPGAFKKTFKENRSDIKILFQHGHDPVVGDKPLGPLADLREDDNGAYYEAPLLDTSYNRDLLPGLEAGLYGASFKFRVIKEEFDQEPERSKHNPEGIPERTIQEAQVYEGGPVTFPAYAGATAGVRSMTDEMLVERMVADPERMRELLNFAQGEREQTPEPEADTPALEDEAEVTHSEPPSRDATSTEDDFWSSLADEKEPW